MFLRAAVGWEELLTMMTTVIPDGDCRKMGEMHWHLDESPAFKGATADRFIKIVVVSGCWCQRLYLRFPGVILNPPKVDPI